MTTHSDQKPALSYKDAGSILIKVMHLFQLSNLMRRGHRPALILILVGGLFDLKTAGFKDPVLLRRLTGLAPSWSWQKHAHPTWSGD